MKRIINSVISIILCFGIVFLCSCTKSESNEETTKTETEKETVIYTDTPTSVKKTETVYVNLDNSGNTQNIIVSDWLHTDKGEVNVKDKSNLTDITNAKSDEVPEISGENLTWNMKSTDLYYRGTSNSPLPISINIKYYLDNKEVTANELKGKSGKIDIKLSFKNNIYTTKTVNGENITVYSPFLVVGGMILPEDKFSAITVNGGTSIGDGSKQIAIVASLPGLTESLGIDKLDIDTDKLKLTSDFTISCNAENFSLENMYFAAIPFSDLDTTIEIPGTVSDLETDFNNIKNLINSVYSMDPEKLINLIKNNENGITELSTSITNAAKLYEENKELITVLKKYLTAENVEKLKTLLNDVNEADLQQYKELLENPVFKRFFKDLPTIAQDLDEVMPIIESLNEDLEKPEVKASLEKLPETLTQLSEIIGTVTDNRELIDALLELTDSENLSKINDILDAVSKYDVSSMIKEYSKLAKSAEGIAERFTATTDFAKQYKIYTLAEESQKTSVAFIFNTPSIK